MYALQGQIQRAQNTAWHVEQSRCFGFSRSIAMKLMYASSALERGVCPQHGISEAGQPTQRLVLVADPRQLALLNRQRHRQFVHPLAVDVPLGHAAGHAPAEALAELEVRHPVAPVGRRRVPQEMWIGRLANSTLAAFERVSR